MNGDWLAQLAPAHAPPPPGWWPPAPGWWGLALLLLLGIAALVYWWSRPPRRLGRVALRELARLEQEGDEPQLAGRLQDLLRRYAVARYGREQVAGLTGSPWIEFLVAHGGADLAGKSGAALLRAAYGGERAQVAPAPRRQAGAAGNSALWLSGARGFIKASTRGPGLPAGTRSASRTPARTPR
jgi:hypothetical protein